jgi:hypothetical protein
MNGDRTTTVTVEPKGFDGLTPQYEAMLYQSVEAGVCGPFSEKVLVDGLEGVDAQVQAWGFVRVEEFGAVCANGFAEALVVSR